MLARSIRWLAEVILIACLGTLAALLTIPLLIAGAVLGALTILGIEARPLFAKRQTQAHTLKAECFQLVRDILRFLRLRERAAPRQFDPNNPGSFDGFTRHQLETVHQYHSRFGERVGRVHDGLAKLGRTNAALDTIYQEPQSPLEVGRVAEYLDALAQTLPG